MLGRNNRLVGFLLAPESHTLIITCRGKHLARRVPRHSPDHRCVLMGPFNLVQHTLIFGHQSIPEDNLPAMGCRGEQLFLMGVPCDNGNLLVVPFKAVYLRLHLSDVKHLDPVVARAGQEPITVDGVPPYLINSVVMGRNRVDSFAACSWVPNLDEVIFGSCQDKRLRWVPITGLNIGSVVAKDQLLLGGGEVPHLG